MAFFGKYQHFSKDEFKCPCCGAVNMDDKFVEMLNNARHMAGNPWTITSGFRCPEYNEKVGGVDSSAHTNGMAADIEVTTSRKREEILHYAVKAGFHRIGIAHDFIHLDNDMSKPGNVVWLYS